MKYSLNKIIDDVSQYESKIVNEASGSLDEALKMISHLQEVLTSLKTSVFKEGFESELQLLFILRNIVNLLSIFLGRLCNLKIKLKERSLSIVNF